LKNKHLLGAHFSISGGIENAIKKALDLKCNVVQIFTKNSRKWEPPPLKKDKISDFINLKNINNIILASHGSYLLNLGSIDNEIRSKSIKNLIDELYRTNLLDIPFIVIHPGNSKGTSKTRSIKNISEAIDIIFDKSDNMNTKILLETTAGTKNSVGHQFEHLRDIMDLSKNKNRLGVCFDTCHVFAAGYDIAKSEDYCYTMDRFDKIVGHKHINFFHFNDCKGRLGGRLDRHEHIGKGFIGKNAFGYILNDKRFVNIPKCLETPKGDDDEFDKMNLKLLRSL